VCGRLADSSLAGREAGIHVIASIARLSMQLVETEGIINSQSLTFFLIGYYGIDDISYIAYG
jgi:hypothetical protein